MAKVTYSQEKRDEVMKLLESGYNYSEVAELTGVSSGTISKWKTADQTRKSTKLGYDTNEVNKSLLELAGDNDLSPFIGKVITRMTLREIISFIRLLGVEGKLTIKQTLKV